MPVLRDRVAWRRPLPDPRPHKSSLSEAEQDHVRAAVRFLARRYDGRAAFAKALGVAKGTLDRVTYGGIVSASTAMRVAIVAGVNPAEVLDGRWPPAGACPLCGHVGG